MGDLLAALTQDWADAAQGGQSCTPVVSGGAITLSRAEAADAVRALTAALDERGLPAGAAVLQVTERRPDWALAVVALIASGRVWLPVPPEPEQIEQAVRRSGVRWALAEDPAQLALIAGAASTGTPIAGGRWQLVELAPGQTGGGQESALLPAGAAYLIPTSGSTGSPKWVVGSRRGLDHFIGWELGRLSADPGTRFAQLSPVTFDPVLREIFVAFASRGCLCVPADIARSLDPVALADWLDAAGIGVLHLTPTLLRAVLPVLTARPPLRGLRHLLLAGEELFSGDLAELMAHYGAALRVYNLYGPTETTLAKFCHQVVPEDLGSGEPDRRIPVGRPIGGATAIALTPARRPCLPGEVGEIYIRTQYRSLGYLGLSPGEPPPAFIPNPFSSDPSDLVFPTRDLAFCRPDGAFVIVGRADRVVKLRGVRVDLAVVESTLRSMDGLRDAAVLPYRTAPNHTAIAAYVVSDDAIDANALRRALRERLSGQAVPATIVQIAELPKTTSGKIDRAALPVPSRDDTGASQPPEAGLNDFEQAIMRIFGSVLSGEVGPDDELLDVGGQSIEAARIAARISGLCGAELTLRALLDHSSPRAAARYLMSEYPALAAWPHDQADQAGPAVSPPLGGRQQGTASVADTSPVPASYAQRRFWTMQQLVPDTPQLHYVWAHRLSGPVDRVRLQDALSTVATRHAAIRTSFVPGAADLYQQFDLQVPVALSTGSTDVALDAGGAALDAALKDVTTWAAKPFAFGYEPLLRARWVNLGEDDGIFALTGHVIVSDGWSKAVLLEDLADAYADHGGGHRPRADGPFEPAATFADFARWERDITARRLEQYAPYWNERFGDYFAYPRLPFDRPERGRPGVSAGESFTLAVPAIQADALRSLAKRWRLSMTALTASAFLAALHHWSDEADPAVQVPVPNRPGYRYERVVGCFTDEVLLRERITTSEPFAALASRASADLVRALDCAVPYDALVTAIRPGADRSDPAYAPVMFAPQPQVSRGFRLPGVKSREHRIDLGTSVWPLQLYQYDGDDGIFLLFSFGTNAFSRESVHRLGACYLGMLTQLAADPARTTGSLLLAAEAGSG